MAFQPTRFRDQLTPGLKLILFDVLPEILKPVATVLIGYHVLQSSGAELPPQLLEYLQRRPVLSAVLASGGIGFVTRILRSIYRVISNKRQTYALGAEYPPWAKPRLPLGIDILQKIKHKWDYGYLGEGFGFFFGEYNAPTVGFSLLGEDRIITSDPWFIKSTLVTDFDSYEKGEVVGSVFSTVLGIGIFSADGDLWKFHRSMARPFFARHQLGELQSFDRYATETVSLIKKAHKLGQPFDFQELVLRFTMDAATEFFLGTCVHSLKTPLPVPGHSRTESSVTKFADAFASAQWQMCNRFRSGRYWALAEIFQDKAKPDNDVINAFIGPILKTALARKRSRKISDASHKSDDHHTLLDHLVERTDDIKLIRDQLINVMIAGRDTTAGTLTFMIYLLAMDPQVLAKLRQEVLEVVGKDAQPTLESIKEMKYMRAVTHETLRLYPAVPFNPKTAIRNTTVTDPNTGKKFFVPKGTTIFHAFHSMHLRKDLWGPDADVFDPERWIDERKERVVKNPFMFLPFQAGPRICLGQQFALNEIAFFMARLLQSIDRIELCPEVFPPGTLAPEEWKNGTDRRRLELIQPRSHLTIYVPGGMWVKMHPAADDA